MYFSDLFQENIDELNNLVDYGNAKNWPADEPITKWQERYDQEQLE